MKTAARIVALVLCLATGAFVSVAGAQVFKVQAGSSSLFQAQGGTVEMQARNFRTSVGMGTLGGDFHIGGQVATTFRGMDLAAGDDALSFELPTDVFTGGHQFLARGVTLRSENKERKILAFLGTTSIGYGAPYFRAASSDKKIAALFVERQLTSTIRTFSRNIFSSRQTAIFGLTWQTRPWLQTAFSAGIGANQRYYASSADINTRQWSVKAEFVEAGDQFRRVMASDQLNSEVDRENFQVTYRPTSLMSLTASHQNVQQPAFRDLAAIRGTVDQFGANATIGDMRVGGTFYDSRSTRFSNQGASLWASRNITHWAEVNVNYLNSRPHDGVASNILITTVRENVSPRLSVSEMVTYDGKNTSISFGGNLVSNRFSVNAEYQTVYVPFRGDHPFRQALALSVRLAPFGNVQLNLGTYVAPDGHVRYTVSLSDLFYRAKGLAPSDPMAFTLRRYMVRGIVTDDMEKPIAGAAVQIGNELAITNKDGAFFVRLKDKGTFALRVLPEEFTANGVYEVVSAPTHVNADLEGAGRPVLIMVRKVGAKKKPAEVKPEKQNRRGPDDDSIYIPNLGADDTDPAPYDRILQSPLRNLDLL